MAKLAAQGGLRMTLSGDKASLWSGKRILERAVGIPRGMLMSPGGARVWAVGRKSSRGSRVDDRRRWEGKDVEEEGSEDEEEEEEEEEQFKSDEFSSFRGLVLDISYRIVWLFDLTRMKDANLSRICKMIELVACSNDQRLCIKESGPINVVCWKRAICLEFMDKADVLEYYDQTVSSPQGSFYIPAVLQIPHLLQVVKRRRVKHNLSRKSIFFRDFFTCQYCSSHQDLTIDHVIPISRGGEWKWENLVTACARCNSRKGKKTLEEANMRLLKIPKAPKDYDILAIPLTAAAIKMLKMRKGVPEEWLQYLSRPSP